jgi:hypothetical protein
MKSTEQLVASIRELRFAIDRVSADVQDDDVQPATRHALVAQAKALQADIDRLLDELGEHAGTEAMPPALVGL